MEFKPKKCKWCGKLFQGSITGICYDCTNKLDDEFLVVREYIYDHPASTAIEIAEATGIEERTIVHFLKEGRLEMAEGMSGLKCERCGVPVKSGKLCLKCSNVLKNAFGNDPAGVTNPEKDKKDTSSDGGYKKRDVMHSVRRSK